MPARSGPARSAQAHLGERQAEPAGWFVRANHEPTNRLARPIAQ